MTPIVIIPHAQGNLETKSSVAKVSILKYIDLFWGAELARGNGDKFALGLKLHHSQQSRIRLGYTQ